MLQKEYPTWFTQLLESTSDLTYEQKMYLEEAYHITKNEELIRYLVEHRSEWAKVVKIREEVSMEHWEEVWYRTPDELVNKFIKEIWHVNHPNEGFPSPPTDWFAGCAPPNCYLP